MALPDEQHLVTVFKPWKLQASNHCEFGAPPRGRRCVGYAAKRDLSNDNDVPGPDGRLPWRMLKTVNDSSCCSSWPVCVSVSVSRDLPTRCAFLRDGRLLATNGGDRTVLIWDVTGIRPGGR